MTTDSRFTRRQYLGAAAATAGVAALAGCEAADPEGAPERPRYGADPSELDPMERYLVLSVHYQNAYLDNGTDGLPDRPTFPGMPQQAGRPLRFILDSMEYQNGYIAAEAD